MNSFFVLTGAPGSGKTSVLDEVQRAGIGVLAEPARQILAEQRSIGGTGLPERDQALFTQLMLSRSLHGHRRSGSHRQPLLFDRGLPDVVAYARLFGVSEEAAMTAARHYRYNRRIFLAPSLPAFYCQDEERRMTFEEAHAFGAMIRGIYEDLGYEVVLLPEGSPAQRARFVMAEIAKGPTH